MYIHRRYFFALDKKAGQVAYPLRIRVQWGDHGRYMLNVGVGVSVEPNKWSKEAHRCKANTTHGDRHISALAINKRIAEVESIIDNAFQRAEVEGVEPTPQALRKDIDKAMGKKRAENIDTETLPILFQRYIKEASQERQWTDGTLMQAMSFGKSIAKMYPDKRPSDLSDTLLSEYVTKRTNAGLTNKTMKTYLAAFRTFGKWLEHKGYEIDKSFFIERQRIKVLKPKPIFLEKDELMRLYDCDFSKHRASNTLQAAANTLLLCSFTGLRISDTFNIRLTDIHHDVIEVRTRKTGVPLQIEINKWSRVIIDRFLAEKDDTGYLIPLYARMKGRAISIPMREACKIAGINAPTTKEHYVGSKRIIKTGEKWEFIATHTGRRTFICTALSLGIPPQVVMKWTGHSDYSAMKPYIDITDTAKSAAMTVFDKL